MRLEIGKIIGKRFERFQIKRRIHPELSETRKRLQERADEHNAKVKLASARVDDAVVKYRDLSQKPELLDTVPIINSIIQDLTYFERVNISGIWVTSFIEAGGNILDAWDKVDQALLDRREETQKIIDSINHTQGS